MSITIVSAPPTPAPVAAPEGSSDAAAGQDFANLLLGQLAVSLPLPATTVAKEPVADPTETVSTDTVSSDAVSTDAISADAVSADATALLATLGLVMPQVKVDTSLREPGQTDQTTAAAMTALPAAASLKVAGAAEMLMAEVLPTTAPADQAAKFAVAAFAAPVEDAATVKSVPSDALSSNITVPANSTSGSVNHVAVQRDTALALPTPVRDQNWASDFGQKIVWLASNDKQSAQLTLNPPQMGPIEISLNMDKGNATVSFASANAEVRDAIESALPRLREMFASAGIELGQTNVGAESFNQQQAGNGERNQSSSRAMSDTAILAAETTGALQARAFAIQQGNGMVDIFA